MRIGKLLLASSLLACMVGCQNAPGPNTVAMNGPAITANPVGPVPGDPQHLVYTTNPYTNDPVALQDGRRLFNWYNCSGCHGGHAGGGMGPSLRDEVWLYGSRDDQIFDSIAHGRSNGMPAWGTKIPQDQIWQLVAYIKSMRTPMEPDPPVEPSNEKTANPDKNTVLGVNTQTPEGRR